MKQHSIQLLFGYHPVREALIAQRRRFDVIYLAHGKGAHRRDDIVDLAGRLKIEVQWSSAQQLTSLIGHAYHQDVVAKVSDYPICPLTQIVHPHVSMDTNPPQWVILLDQVVDPQNLGAIVRTALCAGVNGVVLPKNHSAPPSPAVSKASAGALEHMAVAYETNMVTTIKALKNNGFWVVGADRDGEQSLFEADLTGPLGIVIGSEEKGVRPLVKRHCDFTIGIPQTGPVGSLNASAAAAIIIYEALRQRMAKQGR